MGMACLECRPKDMFCCPILFECAKVHESGCLRISKMAYSLNSNKFTVKAGEREGKNNMSIFQVADWSLHSLHVRSHVGLSSAFCY